MFSFLFKRVQIISLCFVCGCAPMVQVSVDSICSKEARLKTRFVLLPADENISQADLQFQEYAGYVEKALLDIGFECASSYEDANVAIVLSYGISEPQTYTYAYSVPVYGQTGIQTQSTGSSCGRAYSSYTTTSPIYGIVGTQERIGMSVNYVRGFSLLATDMDRSIELWSTKVTSVGASGDLREIFPILVVASKDYMAANSGREICITISENDKRIAELLSN